MANESTTIFKTPTASDPVLAEVVRRLVEAYRPERVYLFGSVARGDAGPDSDYDLLVVVQDDAPPEHRRSRLAYEVRVGPNCRLYRGQPGESRVSALRGRLPMVERR